MIMLKVTFRKGPLKVLRRMEAKLARRLRDGVVAVAADPSAPGLDVRPLVGRPGFRLRVGDWRVIFEQDDTVLDVLAIEQRGDVYKPRKRR